MAALTHVASSGVEDPLLAFVPLPFRREFYPKGFPVLVATNSALVLAAAEDSWGGSLRRFSENPIELRCLVSESGSKRVPPPPIVRAQGRLFISVADAENYACCDLSAGFGSAWVTESAAEAREYFRYHVLEALASTLLEVRHLVDIHAACVSLHGHGALLAGDSGAGKSSLAYACARRGWTYCSDDASSLVRRGAGRVVLGNPRAFRFRETAGELFPEFRGMTETWRSNGKPTIEVQTAFLPEIQTALESQVDYIVFLNRHNEGGKQAEFVPVSREEAAERLLIDPWPAELPARQERKAAIQRLAGAEMYEMHYRDLDNAVDCLEQLVLGDSK